MKIEEALKDAFRIEYKGQTFRVLFFDPKDNYVYVGNESNYSDGERSFTTEQLLEDKNLKVFRLLELDID